MVRLRLSSLTLCLFLFLLTILGSAKNLQAREHALRRLYTNLPPMIGLVSDSRCTLYTVTRDTGDVYSLPPSSPPVLLAKVPGKACVLAVDRIRNVFIGTQSGAIYLVEIDGTMTHVYTMPTTPVGMTIDRDGNILIATNSGEIFSLSRDRFYRK